jgi:hypothetical protein
LKPGRRQFLKVGIVGGLVLAGARWLDRPQAVAAPAFRVLDARSASAVAALVPVVLDGALPRDAAARKRATDEIVEAFDRAVSGLSASVQKEVDELFTLLRFAPVRLMFTGLWSPLEESTPEDIADFLTRWRHSRFDIQRAGYQALTQLLQAAWYGNPASWAGIGYPGAPQVR